MKQSSAESDRVGGAWHGVILGAAAVLGRVVLGAAVALGMILAAEVVQVENQQAAVVHGVTVKKKLKGFLQ